MSSKMIRRQRMRTNFGNFMRGAVNIGARVLPMIAGMGDYNINYNSLMSNGASGEVPQFGGLGNGLGSIRVRHREYIQDVFSSTSFVNDSFPINPANSEAFPWLSGIAQQFQEYRFHGLVFFFKSMSAEALNSTNTALGTVIMSTDYNAASSPYQSKSAAENAQFTVSCKPSEDLVHGIECDPSQIVNQGHLYVAASRNGTAPPGEDIKTYNMGNFQIMTQGSQAVANIGELWVTYDIELLKPIDNAIYNRPAADHFYGTLCQPGGAGSGFMFGSAVHVPVGELGIGTSVTSDAGFGVITFPDTCVPGQKYRINAQWFGTAATVGAAPVPVFENCFEYVVLLNHTTGILIGNGATPVTETGFEITLVIGPTAVGGVLAKVTLASYDLPSNANVDVIVQQLPINF